MSLVKRGRYIPTLLKVSGQLSNGLSMGLITTTSISDSTSLRLAISGITGITLTSLRSS
jgi:hypothetical protein